MLSSVGETPTKQYQRKIWYSTEDLELPMLTVLLHGADGKDLYTHANRKAPRCLPCNYTDPAEQSFSSPPEEYPAPRVGVHGAETLASTHAAGHVHLIAAAWQHARLCCSQR